MSLEPKDFTFDLIVIGGGIAGSGVARDAALRGLSCLLVDKDDFSSGSSSKTSRVVHGGLSHLERGEFNLALETMHERDLLVRMAPHLLSPMPLLMPVFRTGPHKLWKVHLALRLYDWANLGRVSGQFEILDPASTRAALPTLRLDDLQGAALFREYQLCFPERLVLENILSAREHGAFCLNYHEVLAIEDGQDHLRVMVRDVLEGTVHRATARVVVNAAGVWADAVSDRYQKGLAPKVHPMRGAHLVIKSGLDRPVCAFSKADGRLFFAVPLEGLLLLGLARSDTPADIDDASPTKHEAEVLAEEFRRLLPRIPVSARDFCWAQAGLHPLAIQEGKGDLFVPSHRHILRQEGSAGRFLTVVGATFSTFRKMAEETVDAACKLLRHPIPSSTDRVPFFGGGFRDSVVYRENLCEWSKGIPDLPRESLDHLIGLYGRRCCEVIHTSRGCDEWREPVASGYRDIKAQVVYAVRSEDAHHLSDVILRRLRMGLSEDRGLAGAPAVAEIMASELGWDEKTKRSEVEAFEELLMEGVPFDRSSGCGRGGFSSLPAQTPCAAAEIGGTNGRQTA